MDLYITRLVIGNTDNEIFCGIGKTLAGAIKALEECIPGPINLANLSTAPTGIICRWIDYPNTYIWFKIHNNPTFNGDTAWVITKRNEGQMTERVFALFDSKDKAIEFIEQQVDEPMYTFKEKYYHMSLKCFFQVELLSKYLNVSEVILMLIYSKSMYFLYIYLSIQEQQKI